MDADDVSELQRLERQVHFLERHPNVVAAGSRYTIIDQDGREIGRRWTPCADVEVRWMLQFCSPFAHGAVMMRAAALPPHEPVYDEALAYAMDYDLWVRLAERGRLANLDEFLLRWRVSPGSMTSQFGDRTERLDRVTAAIAERLGWRPETVGENERRADLLCAIVAGQTPDASVADTVAAVRSLFDLHEDFCRSRGLDASTVAWLRTELRRQSARTLYWLGHLYPDKRDRAFAWHAWRAAVRLSPASFRTREALSLATKIAGGQMMTAAVRRFSGRQPV